MHHAGHTCAKITAKGRTSPDLCGYEEWTFLQPIVAVPALPGITCSVAEACYHDNDQNIKRGFQA
jgi:hypothetical protein